MAKDEVFEEVFGEAPRQVREEHCRVLEKVARAEISFPSESYTLHIEVVNSDGSGHKETWLKSLRFGELNGEALL